jgi:hypothetical protein
MKRYIKEVIAPKYRGRPSPKKGKTWEELYGPEKAKELKERLRERNKKYGIFSEGWKGDRNPMKNPEVRTKWEAVVKSEEFRREQSEKTKKLMSDPSYKEWWYKRYIEKTYNAITRVAEQLKSQGYHVIPLHHKYPVPDIIAIKDGKVYAVEVVSNIKQVKPEKYMNAPFYNDIIWVVEGGDEGNG